MNILVFAITFANYNKLVYLCDIVDSVNLRIMKKLRLLPIILFSFSLSAETVTPNISYE